MVLGTHSKPGCDWLRVATGPPVSVSGQGTHSVSVHRGNKREDDGEEGQVVSLARGVVGADHSDHTVQPQSGVTSFSSSCSAPSWSLLRGEGSFKGQCHHPHHPTPPRSWGGEALCPQGSHPLQGRGQGAPEVACLPLRQTSLLPRAQGTETEFQYRTVASNKCSCLDKVTVILQLQEVATENSPWGFRIDLKSGWMQGKATTAVMSWRCCCWREAGEMQGQGQLQPWPWQVLHPLPWPSTLLHPGREREEREERGRRRGEREGGERMG